MIDITIRGQIYKDEDSASYSFPTKDDMSWQKCIPNDPRINLQIIGGKQFFSIWQNRYGIYYAFYRQLPTRAGADAALIVACCNNIVENGKSFIYGLRDILDYCVSKDSSRDIDDSVIAEKVNELEKCLSHYQLTYNDRTNNIDESFPDGYIVYHGEQELFHIIQNPIQTAYNGIKNLFVVEEGFVSSQEPNLRKITDKIRNTFFIKGNNGAIPYKSLVLDGQDFSVIYRKPGYEDEIKTFRIERANKYYEIDGNEIRLRSAEEVGIVFKKRYTLQVKNKDNSKTLDRWEMTIDSQSIFCDNGQCSVLLPDGEHTVQVKAKGYKDCGFKFDTKKYSNNIVFPVEPKEWQSGDIHIVTPNTSKGDYSIVELSAKGNSMIAKYIEDICNKEKTRLFYISKGPIRKTPRWLFIALIICSLIIGFLIGLSVPKQPKSSDENQPEKTESGKGVSTIDTPVEENEKKNEDTKEQEDIHYLSSHIDVWHIDSLKSQKYKSFLKYELLHNNKTIEEHPEIENDLWHKFYEMKKTKKLNYRDSAIKNNFTIDTTAFKISSIKNDIDNRSSNGNMPEH